MADEEIRRKVAAIFQRLEDDPSRRYFRTAVDELFNMGSSVIPFILDHLRGKYFAVHGMTYVPSVVLGQESLVRQGKDAKGISVLRDSLQKAMNRFPDRELFIVVALHGIKTEGSVAILSELMTDLQPITQQSAVSALGAFWEKYPEKASSVVNSLARVAGGAAKDSLSSVRISSIDWLRKIGEKDPGAVASAMPDLIEAWRTRYIPDAKIKPDLKKDIAEGLKEIRAQEEERVNEIRATAYTLIWAFADARAIPALSEESKSRDKHRKADAVYALGEVWKKNPAVAGKVLPVLLEASLDPDKAVRRKSIHSLATLGDAKIAPSLIRALKDEDPKVRFEAIGGLRRIGDRRALPELRRISKTNNKAEGDAAYEAMHEILKRMKPLVRKSVHRPQRKKTEDEWQLTRSQKRAYAR